MYTCAELALRPAPGVRGEIVVTTKISEPMANDEYVVDEEVALALDTSRELTAEIEPWVFESEPGPIRERLDSSEGEVKFKIALAVQTRIAIGDPAFELAFPEYAHANPDNHDW
ncbi:hypothetical protein [Pseudomonas chlororaphis]